MKRNTPPKISGAVKRGMKQEPLVKEKKEFDGNPDMVISTGSTLLDLAISGGRIKGGGIPAGILVEIFGASGTGKTVLLCEIAGAVQRQSGEVMFHDPEARLNKQFAQMFDLDTGEMSYGTPDTVTELFEAVRGWKPTNGKVVNCIAADSLAALSTELEMEKDEGDKMGMRRAKEFSEQLRRTCRMITKKNLLMVCSNQVRQNADAGAYSEKYSTPGGVSVGFYSSLRLRAKSSEKITMKKTIGGKETSRVIGVKTVFEVYKSSIWKPYRIAPVYILFDYGVDDIRGNLQYVKEITGGTTYSVGDLKLDKSMEESIKLVEEGGYEAKLRAQVISLWEKVESRFEMPRKPKQR